MKYLFLILTCLLSISLSAEIILKPTENDIKFDLSYKGTVSVNTYEKWMTKEKYWKAIYSIVTVESGPNLGAQVFYDHTSNKYEIKDLPDTYVERDSVKYYVYDYGEYWVYHNFYDEFLIVFE